MFAEVLCLIAIMFIAVVAEEMHITFVNDNPDETIELFWEDEEDGRRLSQGTVSPRGGSIAINTYAGHEFSYDLDGERHTIKPSYREEQFVTLNGKIDTIMVRCDLQEPTSTETETLVDLDYIDIMVKPYWAPIGAHRFLQLVREQYYDGVAFNRAVPGFLTQFGIAKDYEQRTKYDSMQILDDTTFEKFKPGYISFAGSGKDSRTTEIFIVMPNVEQEQLDYFGENSWETPFAYISEEDTEQFGNWVYTDYGDMPEWGKGPDSSRIYDEDGYDYLESRFPNLSYIDRCYVVSEESFESEL